MSFMPSQIIFLYFFFFLLRSPKPAAVGFSVPKYPLIISFDTQIPWAALKNYWALISVQDFQTISTMKKLVLALKNNEYVRQIVSGESKHIKTGYQ